MRLMLSTLMMAALVAVAGPAFAQDSFSADLVASLKDGHDTVIEGVAWRCDAAHCQTMSDLNGAEVSRSCHELAREVGQIASFQSEGRSLSPAQLAACNKGVSAGPSRP